MPKNFNPHAVIFLLAGVLALATAGECHSITHLPSLLYGALLWGWWALIASVLWRLGQKIHCVPSLSPRTVSLHILTGTALGDRPSDVDGGPGLSCCRMAGTGTALAGVDKNLLHINRLGMELLLYGFLFGITGVVQSQIRMQREAMRSLELQRQLSTAHLRALQMQLEPHFLFNTLNAITTLVELGRQKAAAEMLAHLNSILKSTLTRSTPEKVPLSQELEMMENYLAIEQVRFADRLRIEINVDPRAVDGLVPCFLLQPIVENAIRHGIARCENQGLVEASARRDGDLLHMLIRDTGPGGTFAKQNGHGIGLSNTRERLAHFYPNGYKMQAQALGAGGFEVAITIPYECNAV